jgi:hypothetical protein
MQHARERRAQQRGGVAPLAPTSYTYQVLLLLLVFTRRTIRGHSPDNDNAALTLVPYLGVGGSPARYPVCYGGT